MSEILKKSKKLFTAGDYTIYIYKNHIFRYYPSFCKIATADSTDKMLADFWMKAPSNKGKY